MKKQKPITTTRLKLKKHVKNHVRLAIVPHHANQFRPHLIRRYGLLAIVVLVISLHYAFNLSGNASILGIKSQITATELLDDANHERAARHVAPLKYNEQLATAAALKAHDMLRQQYWSHTAPNGTTPWQWFRDAGYQYAYAGENLAKNFSSADTATMAWMASPKHRENLLNSNFTDVGYAVVDGKLNGENTTLIVSLFGRPASAPTVAGISAPQTSIGQTTSSLSLITRFGIALQSLTPSALGSILLVSFAGLVAILAHLNRRKLPRHIQKSWRLHHGLIKAVGMASLTVVILILYSGGQI